MNYQEITKYYGKTAMIYHSLGVLMFDNPVKIFPESEQEKRRRYYLRVLDGKEDRIVRVHSVGKIEVNE